MSIHNARGAAGWTVLPTEGASLWDEMLLGTHASFHQFPFWTEPYRKMGITPTYLVHGDPKHPTAYACLQSVGMPGFRLGIMIDGPISLNGAPKVPDHLLHELVDWARRSGYIFLKFTHFDPDAIQQITVQLKAEASDPFPFFGHQSERLVINLVDDEEAMLASFDREVRRQIRAATRVNFEIRSSDSPESLAELWPMIERLTERKGFRVYRPEAGWQELLERASKHQCARVYSASLDSRVVQAIMVVRDANTAEYMLGALDLEALGDNPSPACLLQWNVMKDMRRLGCSAYNLGPPTGTVYRFKKKFNPTHHHPPPPVFVPIRSVLSSIWCKAVLGIILKLWPQIRAMATRGFKKQTPGHHGPRASDQDGETKHE